MKTIWRRVRSTICHFPFAIAVMSCAAAATAAAQVPPHAIPETVAKSSTHETTTADVPGIDATTSKCPVSSDETYGYSPANPIKTGGGVMYGPLREVRHMWILRGPAGQGVHFMRGRSEAGPDRTTILDVYTVDYPGLEKPLILYLDEYHWETPKAPKGLTCGLPSDLGPPGPDPMETQIQMRTLAIEAAGTDLSPIPLGQDGSTTHGVVLDYTRLLARAARTALAEGRPLDPKTMTGDLATPHLVIVANALTCEGKPVLPQSVSMTDANGNAPPNHTQARGAQAKALAQGFEVPEGAMAVVFRTPSLINNARITIRYDGPLCGTTSTEVMLPVRGEAPRIVRPVPATAPAGATVPAGTRIGVRVAVGLDEKVRYPSYVNGPAEFADAAIAAAGQWQIAPARMNGAPVIVILNIGVPFGQ